MNPYLVGGLIGAAVIWYVKRGDPSYTTALPPSAPPPVPEDATGQVNAPGPVGRLIDPYAPAGEGGSGGVGFGGGLGLVAPAPARTGLSPDPAGPTSTWYIGQTVTAGQFGGTNADGTGTPSQAVARTADYYGTGNAGLKNYGISP